MIIPRRRSTHFGLFTERACQKITEGKYAAAELVLKGAVEYDPMCGPAHNGALYSSGAMPLPMRSNLILNLLIVAPAILLAGCLSKADGPLKPAPAEMATPEPCQTTRPFCFRAARIDDLRMLVSTRRPGPDGFPLAVVEMWNNGGDEVLVEYAADTVVLHCGPYEQHGPVEIFGRRREILDPHEELNFKMPVGGWSNSASGGERDLMLPTELPKGKYEMWATFRLAGPNGGSVESDHSTYLVQ